MTKTIRFIDLFGGIGGFRHGLEQASDKFECVDYIEYDKYAVKSYNEIFKEEHEPRDVTELSTEQIADHDLLCAGFPCQSFSVAGNRKGTDEARSKLFREIVRIAEAKRPEMLLLENVKGILSQKVVKDGESVPETKGHAFTEVLQALHELGYCLEWQVLNSKNWGVPQNRERVFIIGHLGGEPRRKVFPIRREDRRDTEQDESVSEEELGLLRDKGDFRTKEIANCLDANYWKGMDNRGARTHILNHQFRLETRPSIENGQSSGSGLLYNSDYSYAMSSSLQYLVDLRDMNRGSHEELLKTSPTLRSERQGISVLQLPRGQNDGGEHNTSPTLSSSSWQENNFLKKEKRIRKLTPKECWRLQGFPDQSFKAAEQVNSNTQLYKQAGNAVTVNVIKALGKEIQVYFG